MALCYVNSYHLNSLNPIYADLWSYWDFWSFLAYQHISNFFSVEQALSKIWWRDPMKYRVAFIIFILIALMILPTEKYDDVTRWKHFTPYWPFVWGIHRSPVNFPHKGQWFGALVFSAICAWRNGCVNKREAVDDVIVMRILVIGVICC